MDNIECEGFTFVSNFDSANLARVELVRKKENAATIASNDKCNPAEEMADYEFNIWTKPDCAGTEFENFNRTWFYFGIKGGVPFALVKLNIVNLNKQSKMYSQGMAPVFRIVPGRSHWDRIKDKPSFTVEDNIFTLSFKYRTPENLRASVYFAFTYPYSYTDLQNMLSNCDVRFNAAPVSSPSLDDIYYHRECICHSLEGRRIDLITISSHHGMSSSREPRLKCLFPDSNILRPFNLLGKKVVFVSARVHPGETPSSFVFNGFLNLLLNRDDPIAILLRKLYVFKLIPMLNPDGVAKGHYRTDPRGVNLNRVYLNPSRALHPSVFAARSLICFYHHGREIDLEEKSECELPILTSPGSNQDIPIDDVTRMSEDCQLPVELCQHVEENIAQSDETRVSNIENQVSELTLQDEHSQPPSWDTSSVYSSIRENLLKNVLNACNLSEGQCSEAITAVGEGLPNSAFILEQTSSLNFPVQKNVLSEEEPPPVSMFDCRNLDVLSVEKSSKDSISDSSANSSNTSKSKQPTISIIGYGNVITSPEDSGLFLYVDLHGHASKKGIFMYGNHFDNADDSVECMLLPRIMALNSQNFHFTACNFTERNMYLRDRRDGMSREGSGRVAVLKATGLVRSYTLECNYNTGRLVNILPPCVRDNGKQTLSLLVPPKYCPAVFEEVGKTLGVSILDLTGSNSHSRIPNSEFHTLGGIREWLRQNCLPEQMYIHKMIQREKQTRRQESTVQVVRGTSSSSMNKPRARRVDSKAASAGKLAENSDRKENLSTFQVTSGSQPPPVVKGTKSCAEPNENVGPSCSQRGSVSGVLKQVLAVRTKCSVVGGKAGSLGPQGLVSDVIQKKQGMAGNRLTKFQKVGNAGKQCEMSVSLCAFPESVPVLVPVAKKKLLSLTGSRKSSSDQVIAKGPKRMKIAPVRLDQACSSSFMSDPKHLTQTKPVSEVRKLKGKGKKGKKKIGKICAEEVTSDIISQKSDLKEEKIISAWYLNQEATLLTTATPLKNLVLAKTKISLRATVGQGNLMKSVPQTRSPQYATSSSSNNLKPEKQVQSKIPHPLPSKSMQKSSSFVKRKCSELVKKRGKVSIKSLGTAVSKFRTTTADQSLPGTSDKKRKKVKSKFPK